MRAFYSTIFIIGLAILTWESTKFFKKKPPQHLYYSIGYVYSSKAAPRTGQFWKLHFGHHRPHHQQLIAGRGIRFGVEEHKP